MIHFVIPFRSKRVSNDWDLVSKLCNGTLRSICNQTCPDFEIYLVCHEPPKNCIRHESIHIVEVDYPIPSSWEEMMQDKARKIQCGLAKVNEDSEMRLQTGRKAIMVVDADDRVNHNLAQWVKDHQSGHGWYFDTGIIYPHGANFLFTSTVLGGPFYKHCGTSFITYCEREDLPSHALDDETYILPAPHHTIVSYMKQNGKPLKPLPFQGACYVTDTGDNHSGVSWLQWKGKKKLLKQIISIRPLVSYYRNRFSLTDLP